jgi:cyclopropane fatty-acyl-phospholipid synthase-like methyltransferase
MNLSERKNCPFCGHYKHNSLFKLNYSNKKLKNFIHQYYNSELINKKLEKNIYEICECINCSGLFQKYEPDEKFITFLYDEMISVKESFEKKKEYLKKNKNKLNQDYLMISTLFSGIKDKIKILEFGSGWGLWSKFMQSKSLNVSSCEFSDTRHKFLLKNNINNTKNLEDINDKFDFIYSEEVLEHVSSPLEIIKKLRKLLKTNGYMFHRFPSSHNFKKKLSHIYTPKKDCAHPLEHLNIMNKKSVLKMCEISDLEFCNSLKFKNQNFISKIKILKNDFIFNNILVRNKKYF